MSKYDVLMFSVGNGRDKAELQEELSLLPDNTFETLTSMWKSAYPIYDFEEEFPKSTEISEDEHQRWLKSLDVEDYNSLDKDLA